MLRFRTIPLLILLTTLFDYAGYAQSPGYLSEVKYSATNQTALLPATAILTWQTASVSIAPGAEAAQLVLPIRLVPSHPVMLVTTGTVSTGYDIHVRGLAFGTPATGSGPIVLGLIWTLNYAGPSCEYANRGSCGDPLGVGDNGLYVFAQNIAQVPNSSGGSAGATASAWDADTTSTLFNQSVTVDDSGTPAQEVGAAYGGGPYFYSAGTSGGVYNAEFAALVF
jgi:hypothetical protein